MEDILIMIEEETNLLLRKKTETSLNNGGSISRRESSETSPTMDSASELKLLVEEELRLEEDGDM